jgi:calcineurin-like phosphoesterase family protein
MVWVTGDYHIEHRNIIQYCKRPFKDLTEQLNCLVTNHNKLVKKDDLVYFVGDYSFHGNPLLYEHLFNGKFIYIRGNHDTSSFFKGMPHGIILRKYGLNIHLVHDPANSQSALWDITVHGHIHNKWKYLPTGYGSVHHKFINVGVDVWDFNPVRLDLLLEKISKGKEI